jgi:hypothetical protein
MRDDVVADGTTVLFDRGVLGVVVVALAWVVWWLLRREAKRADAAQAQNDALNARVRDDVLPDVAAALRDYDRGRR